MTLSIVGGWYEEVCAEPKWQEFYGPGGRAAAALAGRNVDIRLFTYCPPDLEPKLNYFAKGLGFTVEPSATASAVPRFRYLHWLRVPQVSPKSGQKNELQPIRVEAAENVIRYGFYEGDAIVTAKRAVYDPQNSPERISGFNANGSSAEQLAIVCNYAEGCKLTGETEPNRIIDVLLHGPGVIGVALKGGWEGVWAASRSARELIKPTPTRYVHKIGSGDVFSAEFGYGLMLLGLDPIEASRRASSQVAYYVSNVSLPLPEFAPIVGEPGPLIPALDGVRKTYDIYLAAPFFNHAQLALVEELVIFLREAGLTVFSPYHDVGFGHFTQIANKDLDALRTSRIVIAYLEGYDPGTIFEVGYSRAHGIPVLIYSPNLAELHSTMFIGSGCEVARDFTTAVYRAVWWAKGT